MRLLPDIRYGTEQYPERVARRLRITTLLAWIGAAIYAAYSAAFGIAHFVDPNPGLWEAAVAAGVSALVMAPIPMLHRFSPLAAPIGVILIGYATLSFVCMIHGTANGMQMYYPTVAALFVLFVGIEHILAISLVGALAAVLVIALEVFVPRTTGFSSDTTMFGSFVVNAFANTGMLIFIVFYALREAARAETTADAARDTAVEASRTIEAAFRDLKAAQANLIQAEKMASLGQLTAGIAHEIKNPLNFVNNFAALSVDLLRESKETAAPGFAVLTDHQRAEIDDVSGTLTSNLEKITEHGKRADGIVKAMLEHSRDSSAERRKVDLNALMDAALSLGYHGARAQDQSFDITLERDFAEGIAPIEINPQDITRAFLNIFSNGFYATTRRAHNSEDAGFVPTLRVTTRDAGKAVEIRVRDNGTGIRAEIRDKLFQPFFTTKPTGEGTGLGLSITYDIVTKQHGGTITVDSEVDAFTEFVITLPRQMFANGDGRHQGDSPAVPAFRTR
jgi:signal transduction histidine kinase